MGLGSWWKQMKERYGDDPNAFRNGMTDGKLLTMEVKTRKFRAKAEKQKEKRRKKKKKSFLFNK